MPRLEVNNNNALKIYDLTPDLIGAEQIGAAAAAEGNAIAYTDQKIAQLHSSVYPRYHTHWWGTGTIVAGAAFATGGNANYQFCRFAYQNPAALLDEVEFPALLAAGNYRLDVLADKNTNRGMIRFFHNGIALGSLTNLYSSAAVYNFLISINFSVVTGGLQTFRAKVTAKQANSTGYIFAATAIFIVPIS